MCSIIRSAIILFLACCCTCCQAQRKAPAVSFFRDVFPIFRTACAGCHNGETHAGELDLTSYAAAMRGGHGGPLLVSGKSSESRVVKYVTGALKPQMPPGGGLKQTDIDRIRQWIDAGAKSDVPATSDVRPAMAAKSPAAPVHAATRPGAAFVLRRAAPVTALSFAPDGKTLAVGTYREVQFWSLKSNTLASRWTGHLDTVRSLAYSKDGKMLVAGGGSSGAAGEIRLWDVGLGKEVRAFGDHTDAVNGVAFSPDAARIASVSSDKTVKIWETSTGRLIATGRDHSDAVWGIAWSPDSKLLASCGADRSVKIWEAATLKRLYSLSGHEDVVYSVDFSADSKSIVTASADRSARTWSIGPEGGSAVRTLGGHGGQVLSAVFGPSGSCATASGDKTVKLWDSGGGNTRTMAGAKDWLYMVRFSSDGKMIAAGDWSGTVTLWTPADGRQVAQFSTGPNARGVSKTSAR